jgi:DNA-binding MarR family transcriptional regulator
MLAQLLTMVTNRHIVVININSSGERSVPKGPISKVQGSDFVQLPSFRLSLLSRLVDRGSGSEYKRQLGLSLHEARILGSIRDHGELQFQRLCQALDLEKSQASRLVSRLIEQGLLVKKEGPHDLRTTVLGLTARGRLACASILKVAQARNERLLLALSAEQCDVFLQCLDLLTRQIRANSDDVNDDLSLYDLPAEDIRSSEEPDAGEFVEVALRGDLARDLYGQLARALVDDGAIQEPATRTTSPVRNRKSKK